ncbi:ribonuclease H-like domain-containing protein [Tanacetum coccineum]|uniref:Ribonuclease H-like domain-containing protein n=1 Tax=Tanacetum coccineum TaxID=301880 RepID=A0ABQ5HQL1_9ASTR
MTLLLCSVTVPSSTGNFNIPCAVDGTTRIFLMPGLPIIALCWDGDLITMKFIHAEVECTSSPILTSKAIWPSGQMCSYKTSEDALPSTYTRCTKCPPISASIIIGPSVLSSSPRGGKAIVISGEKFWVILGLATLSHVPAGSVVPTGKDSSIVSTGSTKVIPAGSTITIAVQRETNQETILLSVTSENIMADFHHPIRCQGYFGRSEEMRQRQSDASITYEDFDQIGKLDLEELDIKWKMAMLFVRINIFEKKAGRKMKFNNKDAARFDKKKVKCYKCSELGHFARECTGKQLDSKARYSSFKLKELDKTEEPKALLSVDSMLKREDEQLVMLPEDVADDVSNTAAEFALMGISSQVKLEESNARFDKWKESSKNLVKLINSSMSSRSRFGLGFGDTFGSDEVCQSLLECMFVPLPITGTFMPPSNNPDLDETQFTYGSKSTNNVETKLISNDLSLSLYNMTSPQTQRPTDFASYVSRCHPQAPSQYNPLSSTPSSVEFKTVLRDC